MARETLVVLSDDLTGEKAEDIIGLVYAFGGTCYEIDLTEANVKRFVKAMAAFVEHSREIPFLTFRARFTQQEAPASTAASDAENKAIRDWARDKGMEIAERGRIPAEVRAAYFKELAEKASHDGSDDSGDDSSDES